MTGLGEGIVRNGEEARKRPKMRESICWGFKGKACKLAFAWKDFNKIAKAFVCGAGKAQTSLRW